MGQRHKLILLFLVLASLFLPISSSWADENVYYPYPIIFIHGVNSNPSISWDATIAEFKKYFYNADGTCKYYDYGGDYLIALDYSNQNNGDIPTIARTALKPKIDEVIAKLPEGHKKVIIVAHSMGGLVTRSLLKQYPDYQDKIEKVVFIGTPHLGAPAASAVSILKELNETSLKDIAQEYSVFYSASLFTGFRFKPTNYSDYVFSRMAAKIITLKTSIGLLLKAAKECPRFPDPDGVAMGQLRIAGDVNYHATITDFYGLPFIKEDISLGHSGNETFLGQDNLANPLNYKIIRGVNAGGGIALIYLLNHFLDSNSNNFTFPAGQSLDDARDTGDGIVTQASQEGIGAADYTIDAFHTDEPNAVETILKALDDAPVIESVRVHWHQWHLPYYYPFGPCIIIKVKDYLLGDIEISEVLIDGEPVGPGINGYYDEETGKYKPYKKYGEDFLKTRQEYGKILTSGEFFLMFCNYSLFEKRKISITIKNAAGRTAVCDIYLSPAHYAEGYYGSAEEELVSPLGGSYNNAAIRVEAYNNFLNASEQKISWRICNGFASNYWLGFQVAVVGKYIRAWSEIGYSPGYAWLWEKGGEYYTEYEHLASQTMVSRHNVSFNVDVRGKKIKTVKFIGEGYKETLRWEDGDYIEYPLEDFNISVYKDGDLFFDINTASFQTGDDIQVDITPCDIIPNGVNTWEFKSNLSRSNHIPHVSISSLEPCSVGGSYEIIAEIRLPFLLVTFENEEEGEGGSE